MVNWCIHAILCCTMAVLDFRLLKAAGQGRLVDDWACCSMGFVSLWCLLGISLAGVSEESRG